MRKIPAGVYAGSCIALFSLVFLFENKKYSYSSSLGIGPGFFPVWLCSGLLLLSLCYIFVSMRNKNAAESVLPQGEALKNVALVIVSMAIFTAIVKFFGFIISCTLFLFVLLYRGYIWYTSFAISAGASIFLYWVFYQVLGVQLPVNGFGW